MPPDFTSLQSHRFDINDFIPTQDQNTAIEQIKRFIGDPTRKTFLASGSAGTGKTTLLKLISELGGTCIICAPTNKAVSVLRSKGFPKATTLDRVLNKSIYAPIQRPPNPEEVEFYKESALDLPATITEESYEKVANEETGLLVLVDESSMTNEAAFQALIGLYTKVIFIGDGFQLAPVEGNKWFQSADPDVTLTEIVRTAAHSEITRLANFVRKRSPEWRKHDWQTEVTMIDRHNHGAVDKALQHADIVLAHKNSTCDEMNCRIRDLRGLELLHDQTQPQKGDMLLAWETNKQHKIVKSEIYGVLKSNPTNGGYFVKLDIPTEPVVNISKANLREQKTDVVVANTLRFSFAHCITTHKSQGSEWDDVVVLAYDHAVKFDDHWNWIYTAVTRAKKHLTVII
jgi:exodeoxyribonuclease-5